MSKQEFSIDDLAAKARQIESEAGLTGKTEVIPPGEPTPVDDHQLELDPAKIRALSVKLARSLMFSVNAAVGPMVGAKWPHVPDEDLTSQMVEAAEMYYAEKTGQEGTKVTPGQLLMAAVFGGWILPNLIETLEAKMKKQAEDKPKETPNAN